jgi:hypothetical protein
MQIGDNEIFSAAKEFAFGVKAVERAIGRTGGGEKGGVVQDNLLRQSHSSSV